MISVSSVLTKNIIKSGEANENIIKERGKQLFTFLNDSYQVLA